MHNGMLEIVVPDLLKFKSDVKKLRQLKPEIRSSHAHEVLARSYGFKTYLSYRAFVGAK